MEVSHLGAEGPVGGLKLGKAGVGRIGDPENGGLAPAGGGELGIVLVIFAVAVSAVYVDERAGGVGTVPAKGALGGAKSGIEAGPAPVGQAPCAPSGAVRSGPSAWPASPPLGVGWSPGTGSANRARRVALEDRGLVALVERCRFGGGGSPSPVPRPLEGADMRS